MGTARKSSESIRRAIRARDGSRVAAIHAPAENFNGTSFTDEATRISKEVTNRRLNGSRKPIDLIAEGVDEHGLSEFISEGINKTFISEQ